MDKISVIIPAHQEEEQIKETLDSIVNQSYKPFEVIVVANGCTDNTVNETKKYQSKLRLFIIETRKRGIGYACNLGALNAKGDILFFLDADSSLSNNSLEEVAKAINRGYVGGTLVLKAKEKRLRYQLATAYHKFSNGMEWGPVRFCTAEIYTKIGGHRENQDYGCDVDFKRKVQSQGKTKLIKDAYYKTSMRRFEKLGFSEILVQAKDYLLFKLAKIEQTKEYPVIR